MADVEPDEGHPTDGAPDQHTDDGLDLARVISRSLAGASGQWPAQGRRTRRPPGGVRSAGGKASGAHPDERDPQLLDLTVGRLVADRGWAVDLRVHAVVARWAELVGVEVADHTTPESFSDGRLVVRTDSTAWATQLRLLAPTIVRRLNEELGHGTISIIEVLGPHAPSWKKGPRSVRDGRGPRDTYG